MLSIKKAKNWSICENYTPNGVVDVDVEPKVVATKVLVDEMNAMFWLPFIVFKNSIFNLFQKH